MKVVIYVLWVLSLIAFTIGCCVDVNLMPEWDIILTTISGVILAIITATKGLGIQIPVLQPAIKSVILKIVQYLNQRKLDKYFKNNKED